MNRDSDATHSDTEITGLVKEGEVHRRVYVDPGIFELEMKRVWGQSWIYVGHESQVPDEGDFITTTLATRPVIMVRHRDGKIHVHLNRCAHKGTKLTREQSGSVKWFRCCYHGWVFNTDGTIRAIPKEEGYEDTGFSRRCASANLASLPSVDSYRGFVFASFSNSAPPLAKWLGGVASSFDNLADRSPEGKLEVAGGVLRYLHHCNWKMLVENISDNMHALVTHQSAYQPAQEMAREARENGQETILFDMLEPFGSSYTFFDKSGLTVCENGHSFSGGDVSIHSAYPDVPEYITAMEEAYGPVRTKDILAFNRHNTVIYPSLSIKCALQTVRVYRPVAIDKTIQETWTLRLKGAPQEMLQRSILYNNLIFSPGSIAGHDDHETYQRMMQGLACEEPAWVNIKRLMEARETQNSGSKRALGTSEIVYRHEFRQWKRYMLSATTANDIN